MEWPKPLEGVKVLDLTWVYAGPFTTLILQDLGAEVVKLEGPPVGDYTRVFPPMKNGRSGYFYMLNRGKKSIALNLKSDKGKKVFLKLVKHFDVITENFMSGIMDNLGIGYEVIKQVNPGIIYASISGFGSYGPYSDLQCVDPIAQAMGGLMSLTGYPDRPPVKTGPAVADSVSGLYLVVGILSALHQRARTGEGQKIEVSMMDSVFSILEESVVRASLTGESLPARGNTDPIGAPWDAFPTSDNKWVMVCCVGADKFDRVFRLIGRDDIAEKYQGYDEAVVEARSRDLKILNEVFATWTRNKTAEEVAKILNKQQIPCGIVKDVPELLEDPHLKARNMIVDAAHPHLGNIKTFNLPIKFFSAQAGVGTEENPIDPALGQDTEDYLANVLGMSAEEIDLLSQEGVIWV